MHARPSIKSVCLPMLRNHVDLLQGIFFPVLPLHKAAKDSNFPHVKSLYFAMFRILTMLTMLTKGFCGFVK